MGRLISMRRILTITTVLAVTISGSLGCMDKDVVSPIPTSPQTQSEPTRIMSPGLAVVKAKIVLPEATKLLSSPGAALQPFSSPVLENKVPASRKRITLKHPDKPIRAIYVSSYTANSRRLNELIKLVDETELNAMVLDINSGISLLSLPTHHTQTQFIPLNKPSADHYRQVIQQLKDHQIYLIARIVTFKDSALVKAVPEWTIKRKNGGKWSDQSGLDWIDPYRTEAWEYPLSLAEYAAELGFDEVQFDYVRFPDNESKVDKEVNYANKENRSKSEVISDFLHCARIRTHKAGVVFSADVFGLVGSIDGDMGIGQNWDAMVRELDTISPMIYPSHYEQGMWGIKNPDLAPGLIVGRALHDTGKRNRQLGKKGIATAKVRPWLQCFTATWVQPHQSYGKLQVREQINAAKKAGFTSYMLWNSTNRYPKL